MKRYRRSGFIDGHPSESPRFARERRHSVERVSAAGIADGHGGRSRCGGSRRRRAPRFAPMWRAACLHPGRHRHPDRGRLLRDVRAFSRSAASRSWNRSSLALFVLLFAWIAFSFMSALAGFAVLLFRKKDELGIDPAAPLPAIRSRTAMLLPTYNEDPYRVLARLRAIYESVEETGHGANFDWFVLSDTTDPAIWIAEEKCFLQAPAARSASAARIFYRHRPENTARKSGNIEEWVTAVRRRL